MANLQLRHRNRVCKNCGGTFTYTVAKGSDRAHCSADCRVAWQKSRRLPRSQWRKCSVEGCDRTARAQDATKCNPCYTLEIKRRAGVCSVHKCHDPATRVGHGLCENHYRRVRNTGSFDLTPRVEFQTSNGYRMVKAAGHPVAQASNGWAFEHRIVAYQKYGEGPHPHRS